VERKHKGPGNCCYTLCRYIWLSVEHPQAWSLPDFIKNTHEHQFGRILETCHLAIFWRNHSALRAAMLNVGPTSLLEFRGQFSKLGHGPWQFDQEEVNMNLNEALPVSRYPIPPPRSPKPLPTFQLLSGHLRTAVEGNSTLKVIQRVMQSSGSTSMYRWKRDQSRKLRTGT
jgi:hypothetical protein